MAKLKARVAVIIPTFNRRALLFECLHSAMGQPGAESFSFVVVDDGSLDGTSEALIAHFNVSPAPGESVITLAPNI